MHGAETWVRARNPRCMALLVSSARLCDSASASRLERAEVADETTMADLVRVRVRVKVRVRVRVRV